MLSSEYARTLLGAEYSESPDHIELHIQGEKIERRSMIKKTWWVSRRATLDVGRCSEASLMRIVEKVTAVKEDTREPGGSSVFGVLKAHSSLEHSGSAGVPVMTHLDGHGKDCLCCSLPPPMQFAKVLQKLLWLSVKNGCGECKSRKSSL